MRLEFRVRVVVLLALGVVALVSVVAMREMDRPLPAPDEVQISGQAITSEELAKLEAHDFGCSARGRAVLGKVRELLADGRIVFSGDIAVVHRGLAWRSLFRKPVIYVRVLEMAGGGHIHQMPCQITEVLCHEAVHMIKGGNGISSIEEECDAYAAGLCADAVSRGVEIPELLELDGKPLALFVEGSYPKARCDARYVPVGETREWLKKRAGLGD